MRSGGSKKTAGLWSAGVLGRRLEKEVADESSGPIGTPARVAFTFYFGMRLAAVPSPSPRVLYSVGAFRSLPVPALGRWRIRRGGTRWCRVLRKLQGRLESSGRCIAELLRVMHDRRSAQLPHVL